jgi:hypothetical protein
LSIVRNSRSTDRIFFSTAYPADSKTFLSDFYLTNRSEAKKWISDIKTHNPANFCFACGRPDVTFAAPNRDIPCWETTSNQRVYLLAMKAVILSIAFLSLVLLSCGKDGELGPIGPKGDTVALASTGQDGTPGQDRATGSSGTDGTPHHAVETYFKLNPNE